GNQGVRYAYDGSIPPVTGDTPVNLTPLTPPVTGDTPIESGPSLVTPPPVTGDGPTESGPSPVTPTTDVYTDNKRVRKYSLLLEKAESGSVEETSTTDQEPEGALL